MTGYNHHPGCPCGWCIGGWRTPATLGTGLSSRLAVGTPPQWQPTRENYIIPNARCPVCYGFVFFYRSPHGGAVFFDELGPPWTKHPCTDGSTNSTYRNASTLATAPRDVPKQNWPWQKENWIPILIESVNREGEWSKLKATRVDNGKYFVRVTPYHPKLMAKVPAFVKPPGGKGDGRISWLHSFPGGEESWEDILMLRTATAAPVEGVRSALNGDIKWAREMIKVSGEMWLRNNSTTGRPEYPDFVLPRVIQAWRTFVGDLEKSRSITKKNAAFGFPNSSR